MKSRIRTDAGVMQVSSFEHAVIQQTFESMFKNMFGTKEKEVMGMLLKEVVTTV